VRMRRLLKPVLDRVMPPVWKWYVRKNRESKWKDITVNVPPGVFHPGLFLSTRFLMRYLERCDLKGKTFLELGSGTGMIAISAEKQGAIVTATDISTAAVAATAANAQSNKVHIHVLLSDLFSALTPQSFDYIVINPPYYPSNPKHESEYAWFCGEHFEYFQNLFDGLTPFTHASSQVLMVLSEDCKIRSIQNIGLQKGWNMKIIAQRSRWAERNYIFQIYPVKQE
jgi:release factor glutamine methyltransferase